MDSGTTALPIAARLPFEIYDAILKSLKVNDCSVSPLKYLHTALFISRIWRAAAEVRLYTTVDVPLFALLPFARTMLSRPDLAARVTTLRFSVIGEHPSYPEERSTVADMFKNLTRLTDLHFHTPTFKAESGLLIFPSDADVLLDVPFRLRRLICTFRWNEYLVDVLREQSELREFALPGYPSLELHPSWSMVITDELIPHCTRMTFVPHMLESFACPPTALTNVCFRINTTALLAPETTRDTMKELRRLAGTLRVLFIERTVSEYGYYYPPAKLIMCFARQLSKLTFFGLEDGAIYSPRDHREVRNAICGHLTNLRVLVWAPARVPSRGVINWTTSSEEGTSTASDDEEHAELKIEQHVRTYFARIPTLRIFVERTITGFAVVWKRGDKSEALTKSHAATPFLSDWYAGIDPEDPCAFFNPASSPLL